MHLVGVAPDPVKDGPDLVRDLKNMVQLRIMKDEIQVHHPPRAVNKGDPMLRLRHENLGPERLGLDDDLSGDRLLCDGRP